MCSDDPRVFETLILDFAALRGRFSDFERPVSRCEDANSPCIDFPIMISAPPRFPTRPAEEVSWRNGNFRFGLWLLPGSISGQDYVFEITRLEPRGDGRSIPVGRWLHHYRTDEGLLSQRSAIQPHGLVRCGGRLTFDDVRALAERAPRNEPIPWPPQ